MGGRPGDYQLVEESDGEGRVFLTLRIDPDIAGIDEERALAALRDGLAAGSRGQRLMVRVWSETGALRVRRERPAASLRGKVAPLRSQAEAI